MRLVLLLMAAMPLAAQMIEGVVTANGAPLSAVKVEFIGRDKTEAETTTNQEGAFRADGLKPAGYAVRFTHKGYFDPARAHTVRVVAGAQQPVRVDVKMEQFGKLSGKVTADGKPMPGALVKVEQAGSFAGNDTTADARGEFHFDDLEPAAYTLSARARWDAKPPAPTDDRKLTWQPTWFPSADGRESAAKIIVSAGAEVDAQDTALRKVPVRRIAGRVLSQDGKPSPRAQLRVVSPGELALKDYELMVKADDKGSFEIPNLYDGDWRITAEADNAEHVPWTRFRQTVTGRDIEDLQIRFAAPFTISGNIVMKGPEVANQKPMGVLLAPQTGGDHISYAAVEPDFSFRFVNVVPGSYMFNPLSRAEGYYLASVQLGTQEVVGRMVELGPGTPPVTITYSADGGTLRGTVEDCGKAVVVIAPEDPAFQNQPFVLRTTCQANNRFEISAIRPGDYYAFAFDREPGMLETSTFARQYANQAVRVTIRPKEFTDTTLKVTVRGPF